MDRLPPRPERGGLPMTYAPQFTSIVYNTLPMVETLRELNKQAIKDGLYEFISKCDLGYLSRRALINTSAPRRN